MTTALRLITGEWVKQPVHLFALKGQY